MATTAKVVAQLQQCMSGMLKSLVRSPILQSLGMVDPSCNPSTWKVEARGLGVHPWSHCEFKASLSYLFFEKRKKKLKKEDRMSDHNRRPWEGAQPSGLEARSSQSLSYHFPVLSCAFLVMFPKVSLAGSYGSLSYPRVLPHQ